ncbi:teichuronic acid biosynthesis glycosyltransferase TuaG [Fusobacterium sp. PH5-7]|uniref:glycosyltransferase family 2 protein n=1 Tax=Fusobacterium sp. PH5-7 TaxID=2940528 RepID=UPI0024743C51|nr:glycosyltransferase family 2 protein [Fusobacterium sp. PH5-7]MDH6456566.1 teichuronic acid biosynthesis glycosyltransferase TuaG [Fusobacterium sp. PH5-7]
MVKKKKEALVSIITPLYNSEKYISETIESVLNQTYKNWEMLIVDDCSKDDGVKIVNEYILKDKRIKLFKNKKNLGGAETRNEAIKKAEGKYIAFLDSDDLWKKEKLILQIEFMEKNEYAFTYTQYERIDEGGERLKLLSKIPKTITYKQMLKINPIGCLTAIYNQEKLGKIYLPDIKIGQDFALWLEILKISKLGYGLEENLASYRYRISSLSKNKKKKLFCIWKIYREYNNQNIFNSLIYIFFNIVYSKFNLKMKKIS